MLPVTYDYVEGHISAARQQKQCTGLLTYVTCVPSACLDVQDVQLTWQRLSSLIGKGGPLACSPTEPQLLSTGKLQDLLQQLKRWWKPNMSTSMPCCEQLA